MTRINVGIQPAELPDKLLLAEHRDNIPNNLWNEWSPSDKDTQIIIDRIESKGFELLKV